MKQLAVRRTVTYLMLSGHSAAMFLAPILIADFQEAINVSLSLLPVTAAIFMFIVQFQQENFFGTDTDEKIVSFDAAVLTIGLSALSVAAIYIFIYLYYIGKIATIENLQRSVSLVDTGIITYLILLVRRLFERER